ncbi:hypothetical protein TNIN_408271 [Trichonephila inaurata madagascariensis]|uniref:Uncharacterized protein n=1 Tax=Trichonephila inaurata madagascariensis TaxID=2747483 RepID=A0A8X6XPX5_9ARAC|nr:hypothetical protein TNIN_408271 [Trichonephila inaurata madagascariensis]
MYKKDQKTHQVYTPSTNVQYMTRPDDNRAHFPYILWHSPVNCTLCSFDAFFELDKGLRLWGYVNKVLNVPLQKKSHGVKSGNLGSQGNKVMPFTPIGSIRQSRSSPVVTN